MKVGAGARRRRMGYRSRRLLEHSGGNNYRMELSGTVTAQNLQDQENTLDTLLQVGLRLHVHIVLYLAQSVCLAEVTPDYFHTILLVHELDEELTWPFQALSNSLHIVRHV